MQELPVPHLTTALRGPLCPIEKIFLNQVATIEAWFRQKWVDTPAPLTSSVDLRHAGFKIAPVDTNLFPAGFNNLNPDFLPLGIQAAQAALADTLPTCKKILILPENHTRNRYYLESLAVLRDLFVKAGFLVRIGSLDPGIDSSTKMFINENKFLLFEPLHRSGDRVGLDHFDPCIILLNNDLSDGVPEIVQGLQQKIAPTAKLGWTSRLKSNHFQFYKELSSEFAKMLDFDPWLINPYFNFVEDLDFMAQEGVENLAEKADEMLAKIREKYASYEIKEEPFVVIKADSGTYGMSVMMVRKGEQLLQLNRKQRSRMDASKGGRKVDRVLIQEGVYTFETMPNGAVAEPVVYMIGHYVIGGFYRVHQGRAKDENLNTPGMQFEPLAFAQACNVPNSELAVVDSPNRFYAYGVIARLAALAAAREIAAIGEK